MTQIKKNTLINAHFQKNFPLCIKYLEAQKLLYSPASTYGSQDEMFKISCEILTHLIEKAIKV